MGVNVPSSGRISSPCRARSSSRMISGRSNDTTYEHTENLKPGKISSVTAAPPRTCRRSSTSTFRPARARYAAVVSPLWPPPMMIASYFIRPWVRIVAATISGVPVGTPFHERTFPLCESLNYREWSGYYTVSAYETHHEHEYNAIRNAAALIDISPLFKYLISGRDAAHLVDRVITRNVFAMAVGQVFYTPWCDEEGMVIDDGTVARLEEQRFRWTAADPNLRWLTQNAAGMDVTVEDMSERTAALALQGPMAARVLRACAQADIDSLKYFHTTSGEIHGARVDISRT